VLWSAAGGRSERSEVPMGERVQLRSPIDIQDEGKEKQRS